jgi:DNA-binding transcriptional regulator YhcF (GntR family)
MQSTALALLTLEEARIQEIAKESSKNLKTTKKNLLALKKQGYISIKRIEGKTIYFSTL